MNEKVSNWGNSLYFRNSCIRGRISGKCIECQTDRNAYRILKVELQDEEESLNVIYDDLKAIKESYEEWDTSVSEGLQQA